MFQLDDGYNHCIFCNEIVGEIGFHILLSRQHHRNITKSKNKIRRALKLRKNSIYCDICHEDIVNVKEHKKRPSHKMNVKQKVFELTKNEKFKPVNYQFKKNSFENIILCQVCNIVVPEGNIEKHLNDSKHDSKYKALLKANSIVKTEGIINCEVCQFTMFPTQEINHIFSKKHINNLKSFTFETPKIVLQVAENLSPLDVPGHSSTSKWKFVESSDKVDDCDSLCSSLHSLTTIEDIYDLVMENDKAKDADSDTESIESTIDGDSDTESMNSKDPTQNIYDLDKQNNKAIDADSDTECIDSKDNINVDILFKQYFCDFLQHKQSVAKHKSNSEQMSSSVNSKDENQIDIQNTLSNLKPRLLPGNVNAGSNKLPFHTCAICNVNVPNNAFSIEEHETGNYHKQKAVSLESNDASEGKEYTCSVCNVIVPNTLDNIRSHENGIKHQRKLNELNKEQSYLCTVCNVSIPNNTDNVRTHEMGFLHRQKLNELRQTKDTEINQQHHLCTICNIVVPNNSKNIKSHEMGALHAQKLNEVTQTNKKAHKCTICNVFVPNNSKNIRSHEMGSLHAQELNKVSQINKKAHECTICNVYIPNNSKNIRSHEMGVLHVQNLDKVTKTKDKKLDEVTKTKDAKMKKQPYKCTICNVELLQHNIKIHEKCKLHRQKLQQLMEISKIETPKNVTADFCQICNVKIPTGANNKSIHEKGNPHKSNLLKLGL